MSAGGNKLNHNNKLAKLHAEAKMCRDEKRWVNNTKRSRIASKAYNKASRKAAKNQLRRYRG